MTHVISGRASRADRKHTKQHEAEWLTVEDIGKHLNLSVNAVKDYLIKAGYGCKESKKPNNTALRTGLARQFRHHGRKIFKWNRRVVLPEIRDQMKNAERQDDSVLV